MGIDLINFIERLPIGVILLSKEGSAQSCNSIIETMLNEKKENLLGKPLNKLLQMDNRITEAWETKSNLSNYLLASNDRKFFISLTFNSNEGLVLLQDAETFKTMKELDLLNQELETIINSSFDEIFVTDGNGTVLRINPAGESLYGIKAEQIIGKNTQQLAEEGLYSPALYPIVKERKDRVSMVQRTKTGAIVHVIANPVLDSEEEIKVIIFTSRNISEITQLRKKIERTESLLKTYQAELEELNKFQDVESNIIAYSPNMRKLIKMVNRIASVDSTVLLTGESGVGKGLIASILHQQSHRKSQPFVEINCAAIPETLIESELFGYEPGAFTGASKEGKRGLFEKADGGTLFLDEIGEMPLNLQVKLLKALQDKKIQRVGGSKTIEIDVRIVTATNRDLEKMIEEGTFREDLFYRLHVIPIHIPPLRMRPEDISYLIDYFLEKYNKKYRLSSILTLEAENALMNYDWPGNVRQLENMIERLVVTTENNQITINDLPPNIIKNQKEGAQPFVKVYDICTLKQAQEEMECQLIHKAYDQFKSSYKVANVLDINQSTAIRKIQKYIKSKK